MCYCARSRCEDLVSCFCLLRCGSSSSSSSLMSASAPASQLPAALPAKAGRILLSPKKPRPKGRPWHSGAEASRTTVCASARIDVAKTLLSEHLSLEAIARLHRMVNVGSLLAAVDVAHTAAHVELKEKAAVRSIYLGAEEPTGGIRSRSYLQLLPGSLLDNVLSYLGAARGFAESVELQASLSKKVFSRLMDQGVRRVVANERVVLPFESSASGRPVRVIGDRGADSALQTEAEQLGVEFVDAPSLSAQLQKSRKLVKNWAKLHDGTSKSAVHLASAGVVRRIPRLLGPQLCRMKAFPRVVRNGELPEVLCQIRREIVLQSTTRCPLMCANAVAHVGLSVEEVFINVAVALHELCTALRKLPGSRCFFPPYCGCPFETVVIKTTMGKPQHVIERGCRRSHLSFAW